MGEMCDFEAEFFPRNWDDFTPYRKSGKTFKKEVVLTLNKQQYESYKKIGAVKLKKMIEDADRGQHA